MIKEAIFWEQFFILINVNRGNYINNIVEYLSLYITNLNIYLLYMIKLDFA